MKCFHGIAAILSPGITDHPAREGSGIAAAPPIAAPVPERNSFKPIRKLEPLSFGPCDITTKRALFRFPYGDLRKS
jgi:hypothetical protein